MPAHLTPAEERAAIAAAQSGDRDALARLVADQEGSIRRLAFDDEDRAQAAREALIRAALDYDLSASARLWTFARSRLRAAVDRQQAESRYGMSMPREALSAYWSAMAKADSDPTAARELFDAARHGNFDDIHFAVHSRAVPQPGEASDGLDGWDSVPTGVALGDDAGQSIAWEDVDLARDLLARLDGQAADVIRLAAGFTTGAPMSDGAIAAELGMSRATVQRIRTSALLSLRQFT